MSLAYKANDGWTVNLTSPLIKMRKLRKMMFTDVSLGVLSHCYLPEK